MNKLDFQDLNNILYYNLLKGHVITILFKC